MKPVTLRPARPEDMPRIIEWHREQNERDGTRYPLTRLFGPDGTLMRNVPVALIAEQEKEPQAAIYVELVPELMFAGCNPKATAFARRDIDAMMSVLRWQGYEGLNCRVPRSRAISVAKPLIAAGFHSTENSLVNFFRELED